MRINQNKVPIELHRKAAQHIESIRETEMGKGTENVELGDEVCPIFRPDLEGVAYYEFATKNPDGFIIVSAADHDFPISHWGLESPPVSNQLETNAAEDGKKVKRVFKLDALAYVAEDEDGEQVSDLGNIPGKVLGLPENLARHYGLVSSSIARPDRSVADSTKDSNIQHNIERRGPEPLKIKLEDPPKKWSTLKKEYADNHRPFLGELKRKAAEPWEIDRLVAKFGEGIMVGTPHRVALLHQGATVKITGEAADVVNMRLLKREHGPGAIELYVEASDFGREESFKLHISYENGIKEQLDFFVVSTNIPSQRRSPISSEEE